MFKEDFKATQKRFALIKPYIEKDICSKIISVEGQGELEKMLDIYAGIDYLALSENGLRGISSRIQTGKNWHTFTIRKEKSTGNKTEYEKRVKGISSGYIYPYYTLQAYLDTATIDYAICRTEDLYRFIKDNPTKVGQNKTTNAQFLIVDWRYLNPICRRKLILKR